MFTTDSVSTLKESDFRHSLLTLSKLGMGREGGGGGGGVRGGSARGDFEPG